MIALPFEEVKPNILDFNLIQVKCMKKSFTATSLMIIRRLLRILNIHGYKKMWLIITKPESLSVIVQGHYVARDLESIVEVLRQAIDFDIPRWFQRYQKNIVWTFIYVQWDLRVINDIWSVIKILMKKRRPSK